MGKRTKAASVLLLILYLALMFHFTVLGRSLAVQRVKTEVFWSYRAALAGNLKIGEQILGNILMFCPVGFLLAVVLDRMRLRWVPVLLTGIVCSGVIEFFQLRLMVGWMELDDIIDNAAGALLGLGICHLAERLTPQRQRGAVLTLAAGALSVCAAAAFCLTQHPLPDDTLRPVCVQIDQCLQQGDGLQLTGFAFRFGQSNRHIHLELRSTSTGQRLKVRTRDGLDSADVNEYFSGDADLSRCGFCATVTGAQEGEEYEILVHYDWPLTVPSGLYLRDGMICHVSRADADTAPVLEGTDAAWLGRGGTLLMARADMDCWLYQYDQGLYWVAGPDFDFQSDGYTYIECQYYTSQPHRLPQERVKNGWNWDNVGFSFEGNEREEDYGPYRISTQVLLRPYAVSAVQTGCYREGAWIWEEWFRPVYPVHVTS